MAATLQVYSLDNSHLTLEKHRLKRVFRRRRYARKDMRALRVQPLAPPGPFANSARNDRGYSGVIAFDAVVLILSQIVYYGP